MNNKRTRVIDMTANHAKQYFLKDSSYSSLQLPEYFSFSNTLRDADKLLSNTSIEDLSISKMELSKTINLNYQILLNKDGTYDWRPVQLIHPVVYADLVNLLTSDTNWTLIQDRFSEFQKDQHISCISIPIESNSSDSDQEQTILNWWENIEQACIKYSLDYAYCVKTDVTNCYGSIYTHTISWALHGKKWSKNHRKAKDGLGNEIDSRIQHLQNGQTNGLPQAGALFDLIAEMVMGYADLKLSQKLSEKRIKRYKVIRYRDDYRIFSNSKEEVEMIVKILADVLSELNMHFNSKKTNLSQDVIDLAIKPDKIYWDSKSFLIQKNSNLTLQKKLLQIFELGNKFPNSGSLKRALSIFLKNLSNITKEPQNIESLISIIVAIIKKSPQVIPVSIAILSKFSSFLEVDEISKVVNKIQYKFAAVPNRGFMEIWLQRLTLIYGNSHDFDDPLCQIVSQDLDSIWDSHWLKNGFNGESVKFYV